MGRRTVIALTLLAGLMAVAWWAGLLATPETAAARPTTVAQLQPPAAVGRADGATAPAAATAGPAAPTPAVAPPCRETLAVFDEVALCLGRADSVRNGGERRDRYQSDDGRELTVVSSAGRIVSVLLGRDGVPLAACDGASCSGARLSAPDGDARVAISLRGVPLRDADGTVRKFDAELQSAAGPACPVQALSLVHSDSTVATLCPEGGGGTVWDDQGAATHRVESLDGQVLELRIAPTGAVVEIRHDRWSCVAAACAGTVVEIGEPGSGGRVRFTGTRLTTDAANAGDAALAVTIDGQLALPAEANSI